MTKEQTLDAIKRAKEAHELQMQKIDAAINGQEIDNPTAVEKTACDFGKWLYDDTNHVKELIGSQFYETLDLEHTKWHEEYIQVYNILFRDKKKQGLFSKFLKKDKIDPLELDRVKLYYRDLQKTTERLLKALASSQRRITALNEIKFH